MAPIALYVSFTDYSRSSPSGQPHTSKKDEKMRASGQIFQDQSRLTSVYVYVDGTVEYSRKSVNDAQE